MKESELQNQILLKFGRVDYVRLFRNNVGVAKESAITREHMNRLMSMLSSAMRGDLTKLSEAASLIRSLLAAQDRFTRYGLGVGSSDLIGVVTSERTVCGVFLAMELKTPTGRVSKEQEQWIAIVNARGGVGRVVRSVDEAGEAIAEARRR